MLMALIVFALGVGCSSSHPAEVRDAGGDAYVEPPCHPEFKDGDPCTGTYVAICYCGGSSTATVAGVTQICCYDGHIERSASCYDPGGPPTCRTPPDSGVGDSSASGRSAADFVSFGWHWSGLGSGGHFTLDAACHLESHGPLSYSVAARSGFGTVPASECDAFKKYVVSDAVISAYELHGGDAGTCTGATDDYVDSKITLKDGETPTISFANGSGCGTIEPFVTLIAKMKALSDAYATTPIDAGTDAPGD